MTRMVPPDWPVEEIPKEFALEGVLIQSEIQRDLRRQRARCDEVRAAEGGEEVVECVLVGDVDGS